MKGRTGARQEPITPDIPIAPERSRMYMCMRLFFFFYFTNECRSVYVCLFISLLHRTPTLGIPLMFFIVYKVSIQSGEMLIDFVRDSQCKGNHIPEKSMKGSINCCNCCFFYFYFYLLAFVIFIYCMQILLYFNKHSSTLKFIL